MYGTVNIADLYGGPSAAVPQSAAGSVSGPNQGSVAAPGNRSTDAGTGAAFSWVSFAVLLILLRVVVEQGGSGPLE